MNETESTAVRFADAEQSEPMQYQAVSKAALIAVVLGFASLLALAHWLLCFIPIVTVVIAAFALRSVARDESLVGRKAALLAIALAMFAMAWSITRDVSRRYTVTSEAEQHARYWLELLISAKGDVSKLHEAFQLYLSPASRLPAGANLLQELGTLESASADHEDDEFSNRARFRQLFENDPLKTIIQIDSDAEVRFDATLRSEAGKFDVVSQQFTITYRDATGQQKQLPVVLEMHRLYDEEKSHGEWWVADIRTLEDDKSG